MTEPLRKDYLDMMQAHVDEGGQLSHRNGVDLLNEVMRLRALITEMQSALANEREECAKIIVARADKHLQGCEKLSGMDPQTGVFECALEVRGYDCLCNERREEAEDGAAAIRARANAEAQV